MNLPKPSEKLIEKILNLAVAVQQVPAPTFQEQQRALFVRTHFERAGLSDVSIDPMGNVYACRPGTYACRPGGGKGLLISAHLDTVFGPEVDLAVTQDAERIAGPGIGDNSLAVAALIGLAWMLEESQIELPGDLWLAANVGEEGLGDLKGMREVMAQLAQKVSATIVLEGMMLGAVVNQGIGSRRYRISVAAPGGHSWGDFGATSAVHMLVRLAQQLTQLSVPSHPKTTFNVGVIEGGTSINTIAESASLLLDLRSEAPEALADLINQTDAIVQNFDAGDATVHAEIIGDRPSGSLPADHPLVTLADRILTDLDIQPDHCASSTDANVPLSLNHPAICVGLTNGKNAHRLSEYIEVKPFSKGFEQLLRLAVEGSNLIQTW